jgi:hypothetical protein
MIYRPYFNKPSHAIEWFTDLQLKDIKNNYGYIFDREFPNNADKKLIFKQWEKLIECKLNNIDEKGFNYINTLHKYYRDKILDEPFLTAPIFEISDEELINAKTFYHSLYKLSWLLFSLYNTLNVNRRGCWPAPL